MLVEKFGHLDFPNNQCNKSSQDYKTFKKILLSNILSLPENLIVNIEKEVFINFLNAQ